MGPRLITDDALPGRDRPDPAEVPVHRLEPGTALVEVERRDAWVRVATTDGRVVWVDGRRLAADGGPPPATPRPARAMTAVAAGLGLVLVAVGIGLMVTDDAVTVAEPATVTTAMPPIVPSVTNPPVPDVLIAEGFDGAHEWPVGTEGEFTRSVVGGDYQVDFAPVGRGVGYTWHRLDTPSTALRHTMAVTVGPRTPFGTGCGLSMAADGPSGDARITVLVNDAEDGRFSAFLEHPDGADPEALIDWTAAPPGSLDGHVALAMVLDAGMLSVVIDDTAVGTATVEPFTVAQVALVVVTPYAGGASNCSFDDVLLLAG